MKNKLTKAKFKSALAVTSRLFSIVACFGTVILTCSSALAQNLFVSGDGNIYKYTPNGVRSTFASGLSAPQGLAFDSAGNLFVADSDSIYKFIPAGNRSTFASGLSSPVGLACDLAGNVFAADSGSGNIYEFTPGGVRSTFASGLDGPVGLALDSVGNLFVTDSLDVVGPGHGHVYKFTPGGVRTTFAAGFIAPEGLAFDSAGNLFLVDGGDIDGLGAAIYKFTPAGNRSTFVLANTFCIGPGLAIDSANNLFVPDWCFGNIYKFSPSGARTTFAQSGANFLAFQPISTPSPSPTPTPTPGTGPPIVTTNPATFIASFSATLNGSLNPHGLTTTFHFQYGTTTSYGLTTPPQSRSGNTSQNVSANISSLMANHVYHFRIVASNADGTSLGGDRTFTTLTATGPPVAITNPATNVASHSATLNGLLDPHGLSTSVNFQYGTTTNYGSTTPVLSETGNTYRNIASNIGSLTSNTTYHFRIGATNSAGTRIGTDRTFTTH